jgi:Xaa-Pro aminopeptidase
VTLLSRNVFDHRMQQMRALMDEIDVDALGFMTADYFEYATNYGVTLHPFERPFLVIVPRDGRPFAFILELARNHMRFLAEKQRLWLDDITFYVEHPRQKNRQYTTLQWGEMVAETLAARGLARARIGVDATNAHFAKAAALLPGLKVQTCGRDFKRLRLVKHREEITVMQELAALTDWTLDQHRQHLKSNCLLQRLDHEMGALMMEEAARRFPGENVQVTRIMTLSGPSSAAPHGDGAPTGARLGWDTVAVTIVNARMNSLGIENQRTWLCGKTDAKHRHLYETAVAANEASIEAAVTGKPVSGIDAAAQTVIEAAGYGDYIIHRTGHGIGISNHEYPEDMAFNPRPLLADEVYSVEPGIYVYGVGGFRCADVVAVAETPQLLTQAPKDVRSQTL